MEERHGCWLLFDPIGRTQPTRGAGRQGGWQEKKEKKKDESQPAWEPGSAARLPRVKGCGSQSAEARMYDEETRPESQ